jgi:hypothetical protein
MDRNGWEWIGMDGNGCEWMNSFFPLACDTKYQIISKGIDLNEGFIINDCSTL